MKITFNYIKPLLIFIIPSIIITAILFYFEPQTPTIIIGVCVLLTAACATYFLGIRSVLKETAAK